MQHIHQEELCNFKVSVPPKNIQDKVISEIEIIENEKIRLLKEIKKLEAKI